VSKKNSAPALPGLGADSAQVSVSGISAGAFMATQLQVAYSASLIGVGSIAGGPWNCSEGSMLTAQLDCMYMTSNVDPKALVSGLRKVAARKKVDSLDHLKTARVYLYNSPDDAVVHPPMNDKTKEFYEAFVDSANIKTETSIHSAHGFPTLDYGLACDKMDSPYINNCKFDGAGELLKHIYDQRQLTRGTADKNSLTKFDQTEFGSVGIQLADYGYLYVPEACKTKGARCPVHVALHGCLQALENVKDDFVVHAGYNDWAEGSKIIILYPQAKSGSGNPNACFDWWGFTGDDYATKNGPQMKAIKAMIDRVLSQAS
jgi:poly(3-hydroxybutyrate) depolymerase